MTRMQEGRAATARPSARGCNIVLRRSRTYPRCSLHCDAQGAVRHTTPRESSSDCRTCRTMEPVDRMTQGAKLMPVRNSVATLAAVFALAGPASAQEALVTHKSLSTEVALELARASLEEC